MNWIKEDKYWQRSGDYTVFAFGKGVKDGKAIWNFAATYKHQQQAIGVFQTSHQARQCCQEHRQSVQPQRAVGTNTRS